MVKLLIKWLLPSSDSITKMISASVQETINNSGKEEQISKYAGYSETWIKAQSYISKWLADGKIDDSEKAEFEKAIRPLVDQVLTSIKDSL